ncbi:Pleckstrin homology domain [Ectocarpus siliculosus]|uniref:Pleckstrin homology domain n=1 Tax=Ectocarpus siliculosus TaxID=2880 RepID=D8LG12_ECTSI|nr:Pleckstrin homology domain [Ectocarpus siliculosus]|eukprot:CBN78911.1 Pleckstrin homology domain [Ectocarpus siliculosus]
MTVHMMKTELLLKEAVGVVEQTLLSIPYGAIRVLTWDHAASSLKVDFEEAPHKVTEGSTKDRGEGNGPADSSPPSDNIFISVRVENSIDMEDELKQRARAEAAHARNAGREPQAAPTSVYLGMFAGFTKPKPFQRKRPNLSFTVPEGKLPTLKEMRRWSFEEHEGISRPQLCSLRPKHAMDAVFLGENRFSLSALEGLTPSSTSRVPDAQYRSTFGDLVLSFASVEVQPRTDCGKNATFSYDEIDDWSLSVVPGTGPRPPSGIVLWVVLPEEEEGQEGDDDHDDDHGPGDAGTHQAKVRREIETEARVVAVWREESNTRLGRGGRPCRRVFLGIPDEDLTLARNSMEYFWNARRAELRLPPKAGSTHGRCVASMVTLRGEVQAPALPTGRVDPVDLDGVDVRVGQVIQPSPKRGQLNLLPSPRALLGVEKKRTLRYNGGARPQWERVVVHQGWLRKRGGGAIKRWIWRYFVLYDTPQGHFLAYYNDVSEVPLYNEARRERQLVDLCKVCFLRPEIGRQKLPAVELPANAFTVVTTQRQWTLAADSRTAVLEWLRMISVAVDEDVAVVDDGEIMFEVKAHWARHGGEYGPENAGTVHLGSMGMELRFGFSEAAATSLAALAAHPKKRGSSSASYADNVRFWSFTDFYKWTIVLLQDGTRALAVQCFIDDQFKKREDMLLVTPNAKRLALAIEHQVEKFMSLMHLRLERQENMTVTSTSGDTASTCTAIVARTSSEELVDDGGVSSDGARTPTSTAEGLHRIPSMNLATDPEVWVGDATLTPAAPGRRASDGGGGINPFDSSSDEEGDGEGTQGRIGDVGSGEVDSSLETPGTRRSVSKVSNGNNNPFDFPFCEEGEDSLAVASCGPRGGVEETKGNELVAAELRPSVTRSATAADAAPATDISGSQSSGLCEDLFPAGQSSASHSSSIGKLFPAGKIVPATATAAAATTAAAPSPTGATSTTTTREAAWPAAFDAATPPILDQLLLTTPWGPPRIQELDLARDQSPSTWSGASSERPADPTGLSSTPQTLSSPRVPPPPAVAPATGEGTATVDKCLPPTPLLAFGAERLASSPTPTPPVTPLPIPPSKTPMDSSFPFRDSTGPPSPSAAQAPADLLSGLWDSTTDAMPPPSPSEEQADLLFSAFRDRTEIPPSPPPTQEETDLHLAFRDNTAEPPPPSGSDTPTPADEPQLDWLQQPDSGVLNPPPAALLGEADSSQRPEDFNPFGTPGSSPLLDSTPEEATSPGKVLFDNGSSMRVILEECVNLGRTCSIALRRILVETLGIREVAQQRPAGAAAPGVELVAAAGELLLTARSPSSAKSANAAEAGRETTAEAREICLVGVELHAATGATRVTTKSAEAVLAESVQKLVLERIAQVRVGNGAAAPAVVTD